MLTTKARCCPGKYLYLPTDVRTDTNLADFLNCRVSILVTPGFGASFTDYLITAEKSNQKIELPRIRPRTERFLYFLKGEAELSVANRTLEMFKDSYAYIPPNMEINLCTKESGQIIIYYTVRRYWKDATNNIPELIWGNSNMVKEVRVNGKHSQKTRKLLPEEAVFDLSANILSFEPGIGFEQIESHAQEHGIYVLEGESCFYLDQEWISVEKGDYLWIGSYVPHCCYGIGNGEFSYLLIKDDHRNYQELL